MLAVMDDRGKSIVAEPVLRHGPFPGRLEPERIAAYAAATGDQTPAVLAGKAVPAVFPVNPPSRHRTPRTKTFRRPYGSKCVAVCTANTTSCCTGH